MCLDSSISFTLASIIRKAHETSRSNEGFLQPLSPYNMSLHKYVLDRQGFQPSK